MYLSKKVRKSLESIANDESLSPEVRVRASTRLLEYQRIRELEKRYQKSKINHKEEPKVEEDGPLSNLVNRMRKDGIIPTPKRSIINT